MWRAIWRNKRNEEWVEERKKQLEDEYKDKPLDVGWQDILAMVIAAFQVLTPIFLIGALMMTLVYVAFYLIAK